ncbi:MAG: amidase [Thermodesulfobacteriota bacterium]
MNELKVNTVCNDVLEDLDATALAERLESGKVTSMELVEAAIKRAEQANPKLNAIVTKTFDTAREQAKGPRKGRLGGIPTFIKDNVEVQGVPTLFGTRALPRTPSKKDHAFIKQFKSLGMISLGKTALPEFGIPPTTESLLHGATANPWNIHYSSGGSSGGSAALVAAGVVPLAHGNDGGGSIRIPAACCGLVGLKPTRYRLVSPIELKMLPINVVFEGVITRTVRDTALFMAEAEKYYANPRLPSLGLVTGPGKKRLRIALITEAIGDIVVEDEVLDVVRSTAGLCEQLGHYIEELPIPFTEQIGDDFTLYYAFLFFMLHRFGKKLLSPDFDPAKVESLTLGMSRHFSKHMRSFPFATRRLRRARKVTESFYDKYDAVLCPVLAAGTVKNGALLNPDLPFETVFKGIRDYAPFTALQNITGEPAISLPLGRSRDGLPIGVQFAAPMGHDKVLLELAFELEQARPWPRFPVMDSR